MAEGTGKRRGRRQRGILTGRRAATLRAVSDASDFPALADRTDVVLLRPSHAGNIGAAARALRVMGLCRLRVVAPRQPDFATHAEAVAFASGAHDVLRAARVHPTLDAALHDTTLAIAVSAAGREFAAPALDPDAAAGAALEELRAHPAHRVAFVFGTERTGLSVAEAQRCQRLLSIPAADDYGSLNLAQAVQVVAYAVRRGWLQALAAGDASAHLPPAAPHGEPHATLDSVEGLFTHLEQALVDVGFLDPAAPKRLMPRLRRLLSRTRLERQEVDILRGICTAMQDCAAAASRGRPPRG